MNKIFITLIVLVISNIVLLSCNNNLINPDNHSNSWVISGNSLTDPDGNIYTTVTIGTQVWTVENLRTTKYNDGTVIPFVNKRYDWASLYTPGYCYYNYDTSASRRVKYGALYNWHAVNTGKLAPPGWHVPTDEDWTKLENYLIASGYNYDGTSSENKIAKSITTTTDWATSNVIGAPGNDPGSNDRTGFSALPGGYCNLNGVFFVRTYNCLWWSANEHDERYALSRGLDFSFARLDKMHESKWCGLSVRLLRD